MVIIGYYLGRMIGLDDVQSIFIGAIMSGASTPRSSWSRRRTCI